MTKRRTFLKGILGILPLGSIYAKGNSFNPGLELDSSRDFFKELGVEPFINAGLPYSTLSGSQMWPEVIQAMNYAFRRRARMQELHDAVGERLADMIGCEAAMVSAGAASAITLGTAACMTGINQKLIRQLPDARDMKNEVIIQKAHRYVYEQAVRCSGARLVEVETAKDIQTRANERTVMMIFYYGRENQGKIKAKAFITLGKKMGIPVLIDGATTVPPAKNLTKIMKLGCDLACFSGGKGLQGPFSAGLLLGRKHLIEAARLNSSPYDRTIGRGMKVSKEELLGMMVAVETSLKRDYAADVRTGKKWMKRIADKVAGIPSLQTEIFVPEMADQTPRLCLRWDESVVKISPEDLIRLLREGKPSIEVCSFGQTDGLFQLSSWMLHSEEVEIVASCLYEALKKSL